jgi:hypothetical protein
MNELKIPATAVEMLELHSADQEYLFLQQMSWHEFITW